jgi:nitroreductase
MLTVDTSFMNSNPVLTALRQRNSAPKLDAPAPDETQLDQMLRCALRSPDHGRLRPWRFVSFRASARDELGQLLESSLLRSNPQADEAARAKARSAPRRAPLVVAVMARISEHPKVPAWEQQLSAGCAAFALELAAEALGYAAIWRTGSFCEDAELVKALGGAGEDRIVAFLYFGTPACNLKPVPDLDPDDFHERWDAVADS